MIIYEMRGLLIVYIFICVYVVSFAETDNLIYNEFTQCPANCTAFTNDVVSDIMLNEPRKSWEEKMAHLRQVIEKWRSHYKCGLRMGEWIPVSNGEYKHGSIVSGWDPASRAYWVARANIDNSLVPCKLTATHATCWVPWNNTEYSMKNYEVLVDADVKWVEHSSENPLPRWSLPAGFINHKDGSQETLFIGRNWINGMLVPGYVFARNRELLHSTGYKNEIKTQYEILVYI